MRKKVWLYSIFAVLIIASLALLIVFMPQDIKNQNGDDENRSTSLHLELPQTINLMLGSKAIISDHAIVILPKGKETTLSVEEIVVDGEEGGITYENKIISANAIGDYKLKFSIEKTETTKISKTVNVHVHNQTELAHVFQNETLMYVGVEKDLSYFFSVAQGKDFSLEYDEKIDISDNKIIANSQGMTNITFTFAETYLTYVYNFDIAVVLEPEYSINLLNITNNTLNLSLGEESIYVNYEVVNLNLGIVIQSVSITNSNPSVVTSPTTSIGSFKLTPLAKGESTITLVYTEDNNITASFIVVVN